MINDFIIKEYEPQHRQSVINLILNIQNNEFGIGVPLADQPDLLNIQAFYQKNKSCFWVATYNSQIIGTIAILDITNNNGALRKMFVAKEFRGREFSVGQKLLDTLFSHCKINQIQNVFLGTIHFFVAA